MAGKNVKATLNTCICSSKKSKSVEGGRKKISSKSDVDKSPYCYCAKGKCPSLTRTEIGKF